MYTHICIYIIIIITTIYNIYIYIYIATFMYYDNILYARVYAHRVLPRLVRTRSSRKAHACCTRMCTYTYLSLYLSIYLSLSLYIYIYTYVIMYVYTYTYTNKHTLRSAEPCARGRALNVFNTCTMQQRNKFLCA